MPDRTYHAEHPYPAYHAAPPTPRTSAVKWLLPVGRSWQAIAAGYLGLIAIFVWPLGPVALAIGIWALRLASKGGGGGRGRAIFAIVSGSLATALVTAILITL